MARKILLADDSVTAQNMGRKILADAGYEVIAVNNGSAALKKIAEIKPDLVVLDIYMPGYSGLEVCQRLKEAPETARIPVLLTVGKLEPFKPEEAQRVRAEGFIVKPFEASELLSALSKLEDKVVPRGEPSRPGRFARAFAAVEESDRVRPGEDSSWKNRISFPQEKPAEEKAEKREEPAFFNPVNRDPRTDVDPKGKEAQEEKAPEPAASKSESMGREPETVDVAALAPPGVPTSVLPKDVTQEEVAAIAAAAAQIQIASSAAGQEEKSGQEAKAVSESSSQCAREPDLDTVGFEPPIREIEIDSIARAVAASGEGSANENKATDSEDAESHDAPVTMAATAESVIASSGGSRWTAVAVTLDGEEAELSLHREMQRAHVAAKASSDSVASISAQPEESSSESKVQLSIQPEATPAPVKENAMAEPAEVAESASSSVAQPEAVPAIGFASERASEYDRVENEGNLEAATAQPVEGSAIEATPQAATKNESSAPAQGSYERPIEAFAGHGTAELEPDGPSSVVEASEAAQSENSFSYSDVAPRQSEATAPAEPVAGYRVLQSSEASHEGEAGLPDPETVKSRAAAWANWRQIRDNKNAADLAEAEIVEAAKAAAAGAENSSQISTKEDGEHSTDVASIVDSVLADLRPKLMQEISRKMSEKK